MYGLAKWLFNTHQNHFVCTNVETNTWYSYEKHNWNLDENGMKVREKINTELLGEFIKMKKCMLDEMIDEDIDISDLLRKVNETINNLSNQEFVNELMKEVCEMFYDNIFIDKLDKNKYLIGYNNGVFDNKEKKFRDGRPDDYISIVRNQDYV